MHVVRLDWESRTIRSAGAILTIIWLTSPVANAGVISQHAVATAYAGVGDQVERGNQAGPFAAVTTAAATLGPYGTDPAPYAHAESWGAAGGSCASLLRASASSWNSVRWSSQCVASAGAEWRDLAWTQVSLADPLRLHFEVNGTIDGLTTSGMELVTILDLYAKANPVLAKITAWSENTSYVGSPWRVDAEGWDQFEFLGAAFHGSFHLDVPYDTGMGGYLWGVGLSVEASSFPNFVPTAISQVDMGHSLGLTGATDRDDRPVAVTFDSGLRLNAVPEPSTSFLLALGTLGLSIAAVRKQRAVKKSLVCQQSGTLSGVGISRGAGRWPVKGNRLLAAAEPGEVS